MSDFLGLDRLRPHNELREQGLVHAYSIAELAQTHVNFISHQWLGFSAPDPHNAHLRTMQDVFRRVAAGGQIFRSDEEWRTFARGFSSLNAASADLHDHDQKQDETWRRSVAEGVVWMDFLSIPQTIGCPSAELQATLHEQGLAIASIPAYVTRAAHLWVCAPSDAAHESGASCDVESWQGRGWCRLEEVALALMSTEVGDGRPLLITQPLGQAPQVTTIDALDRLWMHTQRRTAVLTGGFSCCRMGHQIVDDHGQVTCLPCDKPRLKRVLVDMIDQRLAAKATLMRQDPQQHGRRRFWECTKASWVGDKSFWEHATLTLLKPLLLAESVDDPWEGSPPPPKTPIGSDVEAYARSFGLEWPEAGGSALLINAIVQGDLPMVRHLVEVEKVGPAAGSDAYVGQTPLTFAARYGHLGIAKYLTAAIIHAGKREDEGSTSARTAAGKEGTIASTAGNKALDACSPGLGLSPLGEAAKCGHPPVVAHLLACGASIDIRRKNLQTPLHQAAANGHVECVKLLCEAGADAFATDAEGRTPAQLASAELFARHATKAKVLGALMDATRCSYPYLSGGGTSG